MRFNTLATVGRKSYPAAMEALGKFFVVDFVEFTLFVVPLGDTKIKFSLPFEGSILYPGG